MHVEFTSRIERWTTPQTAQSPEVLASEILKRHGHARTHARAVEQAGIERVLIADPRGLADNGQLASFVLHNTVSVGVAVSHSAGIVAPTVAAQQFATLDQLSGGRLAIRIVAGSDDHDHESSLARTDEYLVLLKRLWANEKPFDHEGAFYSIKGGHAGTKPFGRVQVPLILGGLSGTAIKVAAKHADVFALPAGTVAEARQTISRVRAAAACHGRAERIRYSVAVQPVLAATRSEAWVKAGKVPADMDASRLVGAAEQIAGALIDYCAVGVSDFVLHGLEQADDVARFAKEVVPLVRRWAAAEKAGEEFRVRGITLSSPGTRVRYYT